MKGVIKANNAPIDAEAIGTHQKSVGEGDCGHGSALSAVDGTDTINVIKGQTKVLGRAIANPIASRGTTNLY